MVVGCVGVGPPLPFGVGARATGAQLATVLSTLFCVGVRRCSHCDQGLGEPFEIPVPWYS